MGGGGVRRWGLLSASVSNDQGEVVEEGMQLHPIKHHGFRGQRRDEDRLLIHPPGGTVVMSSEPSEPSSICLG